LGHILGNFFKKETHLVTLYPSHSMAFHSLRPFEAFARASK
jgi:hypothetical protein